MAGLSKMFQADHVGMSKVIEELEAFTSQLEANYAREDALLINGLALSQLLELLVEVPGSAELTYYGHRVLGADSSNVSEKIGNIATRYFRPLSKGIINQVCAQLLTTWFAGHPTPSPPHHPHT
jgi:hypothetical protein